LVRWACQKNAMLHCIVFIFTAEYFASGGHSGLFEIYFYEVHISRTYK